MTTGVQPRVNSDIVDQILNEECLVVIEDCFKAPLTAMEQTKYMDVRFDDCFKPPLPKPGLAQAVKCKITKRRQSLRLQDKKIPCMKETTVKCKKPKKKPKNTYLDDIKKSNSMILTRLDDSSDTTNNHNIISNQYPELSDSDILELVYQMTSFIENGVFDDANMDWNDSTSDTDLTLLCLQQMAEPMPLITSPTHPTEKCTEEIVLDNSEVSDLPIINKNSSSEVCFPEEVNDDQHISIQQAFYKEGVNCSKPTKSESTETTSIHRTSSSTQTNFDDCWKDEAVLRNEMSSESKSTQTTSVQRTSSSTQTTLDDFCTDEAVFHNTMCSEVVLHNSMFTQKSSVNHTSTSTQTTFVDQSSKDKTVTTTANIMRQTKKRTFETAAPRVESNNFLVKTRGSDRDSKSLKRKSLKAEKKPCQIFIQNYDMNNFSVNRKVFKFKIPKLKKEEIENSGSEAPSVKDEVNIKRNPSPKYLQASSTQTNVEPQVPRLLTPQNNFDLMKQKVVKLLDGPCYKFLLNEDCDLDCTYNHVLPSIAFVTESIKDWSNELVHFLYTTYIQRYFMCYLMYFPIICNTYVERRLPDSIISTVKDCERFSVDDNFKLILLSLMRCGFGHDDALFAICTNANRTTSINKILEIITVFKLRNFKQTIAFLCTEIESYDFDSSFANEVLRQACDVGINDVILLEFCYAIIRKCHTNGTLNEEYMKMLLMKI